MRPSSRIYCFLFCLAYTATVLGQRPDVRVRPFGFEDGLSHRNVFRMGQDATGFLWVATAKGLNRFDGHNFVDWTAEHQLPTPPNDVFPDLVVSSGQQLWVAQGPLVLHLDPAANQTDSIKFPGSPSSKIQDLLLDQLGNLWATAASPKDSTVSLIRAAPGADFLKMADLPGKYLHRPMAVFGGKIYVGATENELWTYAPEGRQVAQFEFSAPKNDPAYSRVVQLQTTPDGSLWALLNHGQVFHLPPRATSFQRHPVGGADLDLLQSSAFAVTPQGDIWLGGIVKPEILANGSPCTSIQPGASLLLFDKASGRVKDYSYHLRQAMPFADPPRQIFSDRTGVLWIASQFGLIQLVENKLFDRYLADGNDCCKDGVCSIRGMAEDDAGNIYIAYYNSIHVLNPKSGSLSPLFSRQVLNPFGLCYHEGALWTGEGDRIDLRTLRVDQVAPVNGPEGVVLLDGAGNLWFGGQGSLVFLPPGRREAVDFLAKNTADARLAKRHFTYLCRGKDGAIWAATKDSGLFKLDSSRGILAQFSTANTPGLPSDHILAVVETGEQLWLGTNRGIARLDLTSGQVKTFTTANGLPNDFINGLLPEGEEAIWASTDNGLARLDLRSGGVSNFFDTDGLAKNEFNRISTLRASDGRLYFGGIGGVSACLPDERFKQHQGKQFGKLMLTQFSKFDGKKVVNQAWGLSGGAPFVLSHREEMFTFWFSLADFADPKFHLYRYKLEGYDKEWSAASTVNFARYFNIPAGSYLLHVQASRGGGDWAADELLVPITIEQAFYKSWWFQTLLTVLALGLVFGIMRLRVKRLKRHEAELESLVQERTQELRSEKQKSEDLLRNILPAETAEELKQSGTAKARKYENVTVLFSDFKDFSIISAGLSPEALVAEIDRCFRTFDEIMELYGLEKIKTVGDAYLCAGGLNTAGSPEDAAERVIRAGLEIQAFLAGHAAESRELGKPVFEARIGIHSGPVVAGIVGIKKFAYDIWGNTVNIAERLQSNGEVGRVNISKSTHDLAGCRFCCTHRGYIKAKHGQEVEMYFVDGVPE